MIRRLVAAVAVLVALGLAPRVARADALTPSETTVLAAGGTVVREQTLESDDHRYVGGVTYTIVEATPEELTATFEDVDAYVKLLPKTKSATKVKGPGDGTYIELAQGNSVVTASYTIQVRRYPRENTVRFWLEPSLPHAIDDAWGFFRVERLAPSTDGTPRTLLTYAVLVDVGPGLVRTFYEEKLRAAMLGVPQLVRQYVQRSFRARPGPA
jgi:hypothetical protein